MSFAILLLAAGLAAEPADTLSPAAIPADKGLVVSVADTVSSVNTIVSTDVFNKLPGIQTSDYGGFSGLKNVSIRGLGNAHTNIYVDGIAVGNVMSGQGDLGIYNLLDYSSVVVDYARNSIYFNTARPEFGNGRFGGTASFKGGSFGTYLPHVRLSYKLSDAVSMSVNGDAVFSDGDFKYGSDNKRSDNDIKQYRAGVDFFGNVTGGNWHAKAYYNTSDRGTPGSVSWPSKDRQQDDNFFAQGSFMKAFSDLYTLSLSAKGSFDKIGYTSSYGDSEYKQKEAQVNSSHVFTLMDWWKVSLAVGARYDDLDATYYNESRFGVNSVLSSAFILDGFVGNVALEYVGAFDKDHKNRNFLSPSVDLKYTVLDGLDIVAFARGTNRIPTFNDLYYTGYGNPDLKTERAFLSDLGLRWRTEACENTTVKLGADFFYNHLKDKITSAPTPEDPNVWLPYNIGKVESVGFDLTAGADYKADMLLLSGKAKYSFESSKDKNKESLSYNKQIPYVPKHSVTFSGTAEYGTWGADLTWNWRKDLKDSYGDLPDWNTLDLTLYKRFNLNGCGPLTLSLTGRNLSDNRYFMVSGYPMPSMAIYGGIEFSF